MSTGQSRHSPNDSNSQARVEQPNEHGDLRRGPARSDLFQQLAPLSGNVRKQASTAVGQAKDPPPCVLRGDVSLDPPLATTSPIALLAVEISIPRVLRYGTDRSLLAGTLRALDRTEHAHVTQRVQARELGEDPLPVRRQSCAKLSRARRSSSCSKFVKLRCARRDL